MVLYLLFESSIGYGLFELKEFDDVNATVPKIQKQISDFTTFSQICHLKVFIYPILRLSTHLTLPPLHSPIP